MKSRLSRCWAPLGPGTEGQGRSGPRHVVSAGEFQNSSLRTPRNDVVGYLQPHSSKRSKVNSRTRNEVPMFRRSSSRGNQTSAHRSVYARFFPSLFMIMVGCFCWAVALSDVVAEGRVREGFTFLLVGLSGTFMVAVGAFRILPTYWRWARLPLLLTAILSALAILGLAATRFVARPDAGVSDLPLQVAVQVALEALAFAAVVYLLVSIFRFFRRRRSHRP